VALLDPGYYIAELLGLTFLNSVDFVIRGEILFSPDVEFWISNSVRFGVHHCSGKLGGAILTFMVMELLTQWKSLVGCITNECHCCETDSL
jgi:hypothetical protein